MKFRTMFQTMFFLASIALSQGASAADMPILRFHEVSPGIYRGARPDAEGMKALAQLGVKTDLDLENDLSAVQQETQDAGKLGMNLISKPMSGFWSPDDREVNEILAIVGDKGNYPIFIHCQHGQDRTGLIVGLYRVLQQGWTSSAAYGEMITIGFHPQLFLLNHYFEEKTGFDD